MSPSGAECELRRKQEAWNPRMRRKEAKGKFQDLRAIADGLFETPSIKREVNRRRGSMASNVVAEKCFCWSRAVLG
jgi:hypothetical protein